MQSQSTSSFHYSNEMVAELQQSFQTELAKCGMAQNLMAKPTMVDFGVRVNTSQPMRERDLSTEEFLNLFDRKESLKMAYVPHFITQCIMYYLDLFTEYAKENKLDYKKTTRRLKSVKEEYLAALRHEMPPRVFEKFLAQRDEYLNFCGANLTIMYFTFSNALCKKYHRVKDEAILCYANIMQSLVLYVEDFDRKVNQRIAEKMGCPCRNHGDARLTEIKNACVEITSKYPIDVTDQTDLCIKIVANRAMMMINDMADDDNDN